MMHGMTCFNLKRKGPGQSMHRYDSQSHAFYRVLLMFNGQPRIKESLRKEFADLANDFSQRLHSISLELSGVAGPLEVCIQLANRQSLTYDETDPARPS
jgi:hypothetical protein